MSSKSLNRSIFIVKQIHDMKNEKKHNLYLVEWEGYPNPSEYTWEPHKNLKDNIIYQKYLEQHNGIKRCNKRKREKNNNLIETSGSFEEKSKPVLIKDIFKKTKRESLSKDERFDLIRRQNYKCNLCLNPFGSSSFEIDHIIPLEQGGTNYPENLQGLCDSCHIFKTTVLDRGVVARLLQAKIQNNKNKSIQITRKEILEECQMVYFNRNRTRIPFHQNEMLNFCIDTVDIYREMCKREVKKRVEDIMKIKMDDSKIDFKIIKEGEDNKSQPPEPPKENIDKQDNKYLNSLLSIIRNLIIMKIKSNVIKIKNFTLTITINFEKENDISDSDIYNELNNFFKKIFLEKPDKKELNIEFINIFYEKN